MIENILKRSKIVENVKIFEPFCKSSLKNMKLVKSVAKIVQCFMNMCENIIKIVLKSKLLKWKSQ